jgi:ubiquinone/menaquinone biosynthesis C-methylase UbiE
MTITRTTQPASVDRERLERAVRAMYRDVARDPGGDFHFELGRPLAERLGYPPALLESVPAEAIDSFAGVGYALDLVDLGPGERVLDLGSGSGADVFCAAALVGPGGSVVGVDITDEQLEKAERLRRGAGLGQVSFERAYVERLPFEDASFDAVISNGVINLSPEKERAFAEIERVLRPGGRVALADIVSSRALAERTVAKVELWAACVAGAVPGLDYVSALERVGLSVETLRENGAYRFVSERARATSDKYGVKSISVLASKG